MKLWYHKIDESRRRVLEVSAQREITIGREAGNTLVLPSPLVSRRHAVVRRAGEGFELENIGLNSCMVGDADVLVGQIVPFAAGTPLRIWPYTISIESQQAAPITRAEWERHLRGVVADLEQRVHRKLLERLDLVEMESVRHPDRASILQLENNIEDACREMNVFGPENEATLDEIIGLVLRDLLINQIILDSGDLQRDSVGGLVSNEFDVPATLIPERETELQNLLQMLRQQLQLDQAADISGMIRLIEERSAAVFPGLRRYLHKELRKYVILRALKKDLKDTVFGFGPLQDLLRVPTITEIMVNACDQIYVETGGVIEQSGRRFISDQVTESVIERIVAQVGRRIDKSQPLVDARLPDGSRVNAIIPPLAVRGPCLTIRRFPAQRMTIEELISIGSLSTAAAIFLRAAVVNKRNILISGGTGSGKTTMLNALSSCIPHKERVVTVEDTAELKLHQQHVVTLETKPPNVEGAGGYTARDLVWNALRMRPDRLIVGECRGAEALDMLQAMNTGHDGSMTTVHANTAAEVVERLELLVLMAAELPVTAIHRQIASALDLVVQLNRMPGGKRAVTQISEIVRLDDQSGELVITDIFNRRNQEELLPTGYLPSFIDELVDRNLLDLRFLYGETFSAEEEAAPPQAIRKPGTQHQFPPTPTTK